MLFWPTAAGLASLAVSAAAGSPQPLTLAIRFHASEGRPAAPITAASITVVATPTDDAGARAEPVTFSVSGASATIHLATGAWTLRCGDAAFWCPEKVIDVSDRPRQAALEVAALEVAVLDVYVKRSLRGRLATSAEGGLPATIVAQGRVRTTADSVAAIGTFEETVAVEPGGRFTLGAPGALLDLRIAAERFAPAYVWGFDGRTPEAILPELELRPGGSVSGFVIDGEDGRPLEGARIEARQPTSSVAADASRRLLAFAPATVADVQGFFQIAQLLPGLYELLVTADGRTDGSVPGVEVRADEETHLRGSVILPARGMATLFLDPPSHPTEGDWVVTLRPAQGEEAGQPGASLALTAANGIVAVRDVVPRVYDITVATATGAIYLRDRQSIDVGSTLALSIPLVEVHGRATLGDEPILGRIRLQTGSGDSYHLETDADGEIHAWIHAADFKVLFVEVDSLAPRFSRQLVLRNVRPRKGVLELDLSLGGQELRGVVLDEDGTPVRGAEVSARAGGAPAASAESDVEGEFRLLALEEEPHEVWAWHPAYGESAHQEVDLRGLATSTFLELRLVPAVTFSGHLATGDGAPVVGASVRLRTVGRAPTDLTQPTDLDGQVRFQLHPETTAAAVTVLAPSAGLWAGCVRLAPEAPFAVALPAEGVGGLELRFIADPHLPPLTNGSSLLFSSTGGFLALDDIWAWLAMGGGDRAESGDGIETWHVRNVAAGSYALTWSPQPEWSIAASSCAAGPPPGLDWRSVPPGGTAGLELDVRELQVSQAPTAGSR